MNKQIRIGALVIGQTPRADLVDPLQVMLPEIEIVQMGALDGISAENLPPHNAAYPLMTRMKSGETVIVEESFLIGRLQAAVTRLESAEVAAIILLCAGTFAAVESRLPLIKPFDVGRDLFRQRGLTSLGFITPVAEQVTPIHDRWAGAGFRPKVWAASLANQDRAFVTYLHKMIEQHQLEAIVLDYVGFSAEIVAQLRQNTPIPLFDLGQLALLAIVQRTV
ncbi:MAG: AroM family protein [Candidatus Promineifilaceae bacterium]